VHAPTVWSSAWRCDLHGDVDPLRLAGKPSAEGLHGLVKHAQVPVWVPWPLPYGWLVTGFSGAGDERSGMRATAVALSGPNPVGGPADLLLVAEEPGIGLGAGLAGLAGPDPGDGFADGPPHATAKVDGHEAPLWMVCPGGSAPKDKDSASKDNASKDRGAQCATFAGEVGGGWLWVSLWPDSAGVMLVEQLPLRDLRDTMRQLLDVPFGAMTTRLPTHRDATTITVDERRL
jgi:hypothetical protein